MEARVAVLEQIAADTRAGQARLEAKVEQLAAEVRAGLNGVRDRHERDFRITFAAIIAAALGLAGLMARGFRWF